MKNISLAFNAVLLVLIIILFFMYSSLKKSINGGNESQSSSMPVTASGQRGARIAYVNADSLDVGYKLMKQLQQDFQARSNALQSEYETKGRRLQDEYVAYQQKVQSGNISQIDAQKAQQDLSTKKADLDAIQGRRDDLVKEMQEKNQLIRQKVQNYIAQYNKKAHFDYVLEYLNLEGAILLANDSLDITHTILQGINQQYTDSIQKMSGPAKP